MENDEVPGPEDRCAMCQYPLANPDGPACLCGAVPWDDLDLADVAGEDLSFGFHVEDPDDPADYFFDDGTDGLEDGDDLAATWLA